MYKHLSAHTASPACEQGVAECLAVLYWARWDNKCFKLPTLHCREQGATVPGLSLCRNSSHLLPRENSPNPGKSFVKSSSSILRLLFFPLYSESLFLRVKL